MSSPLISVIVPIYNMESLLPRCLDSLAAQTLRDLEIICVDDGSTDGSGGIVRKYASGDSRFRLITQENSGRAEARNAGIRAAAAPYLGFADPDDYVEPDMYERLYRLAEETGADMVQCSYSPFLPAESEESRGMAEEKLLHVENTACDGIFPARRGSFRPPWLHAGAQIYRSLPFLPSGPRVPGRENSRTAPAPSLRPAGTAKGTGMSENPPRTMKWTNERKPPNYFPYGEKRLPPAKIPAPAFKDFKFPPFFKLQTSLFRPERSLHALSLPGLFLPAAPSSRPFP